MKQEDKDRLEELRWENERKSKQSQFNLKLQQLMSLDKFKFLSFEESDKIQPEGDDWPSGKWDNKLYHQVSIEDYPVITNLVRKFLELSSDGACYVFSMNYNFGLTAIDKNVFIKTWVQLIEIDGDEIFVSVPDKSYFLCIEKTYEVIEGREAEGARWIYEITYSNQNLKLQIEVNAK